MENQEIKALQKLFSSRLDTLNHLLDVAEQHFAPETEALLQQRLAPDMFPFGTQVAFTCNQPLGFAQWCAGEPIQNINPEVTSFEQAREYIASTKAKLNDIQATDAKLDEIKRIGLGPGSYIELPGREYVNDFLMPNFYFHLTTAYSIMRMGGAQLGKHNYMLHLVPFVKQEA